MSSSNTTLPLNVHEPQQLFYYLFQDTKTGLRITDDYGVVLSPNSGLHIQLDPYPQEPKGPFPLVVVGPTRPLQVLPMTGGGFTLNEIHVSVEVRVACVPVDAPYKLNGEDGRSKLLEAVRLWVLRNQSNPGGQKIYDHIRTMDYGRDMSQPSGPPLFKSAMSIEVVWIE